MTKPAEGPVENAMLTVMLRSFMTGVGRYLERGGPVSGLERFARRSAGVTTAAVLILWPPPPRPPGARGFILAAGKQLWNHRKWII